MPITVLFQNRRPVVTPIDNVTLQQGQVLDQPIRVTDPTKEPLSLSVANALPGFPLPRFLSFTDNGDLALRRVNRAPVRICTRAATPTASSI